ncbi:OLC1v1007039C2 [Oldenlandia corymbosa var. corymbosa]|nr:OLC1v1007039C2 [Oldenlandia corymbosa var. corymbosa]
MGLHVPGCAETFSSYSQQQQGQQQQQPWEQQGQQGQEQYPWEQGQGQGQFQGQQSDQNQKVRYIRQGDVIAIPAGAAHWCANHDNQQNLVVVSVNDLNHVQNQLDQNLRVFYIGGGQQQQQFGQQRGQQGQQQQPGQQWQGQQQPQFGNIVRGFDSELLAEAMNVPVDTIRKMQREDERGFIVRAQGLERIIRPTKQEEQQQWGGQGGQQQQGGQDNGLEESYCTLKIHTNVDQFGEADVYTRQAGRLTVVDRHKLPFLNYMDMSLEKGQLHPNALISPHWTKTGHSIIYVVRGDAQVETVNYNGQAIMNDRVNQGDMFVVPQFFVSTFRAGQNGFEWVAIKTTGNPKLNPVSGYTSTIRALPLDVLTHSYQISPADAQQLKLNSGGHSILLPSSQSRQGPY